MKKKKKLRKETLGMRKKIGKNKRAGFKEFAADKIIDNSHVKKGENILVYVSTRYEAPTDSIIDALIKMKKNVYVPVMEEKEIKPVRLRSRKELVMENRGIKEPPLNGREYIKPEFLDVVIVPGVCFSQDGKRIGMGGGHYDRFLSEYGSNMHKIGLCFSEQIAGNIPQDHHDIKMDEVLADKIQGFTRVK